MYIYIYDICKVLQKIKAMKDTCCEAYNDLGTIQMEQFLYHEEYEMYNDDHAIDNYIYYQLFECHT